MGRKIPGKKHRKIVDPEKQRAKREASLKDKINNPPQYPDDQEIPKSVLKIIELKNEAKSTVQEIRKRAKKKKRGDKLEKPLCVEQFLDKDEIQPGMKKPEKYIPNLVQRPEETTEGFFRRVNSMTQKLIKEVQFEDKFGVKINKDLKTGKILQVEKDREEKFSKKKKNNTVKKTLQQKRKEKKLVKESKECGKDFSHLKDAVEFGEVVHRPPINLKLSNKFTTIGASNGSKFKNLLLQDLFKSKNKTSKDAIQLEKEEKQRQFVVNAYRERKKMRKKI